MRFVCALLVIGFISTTLCYSTYAAPQKQKTCKEYIYESAERNFWDLNGDYFEDYTHRIDGDDKKFFDEAIRCFDRFAALEERLCGLETKAQIRERCRDDLFIATKLNASNVCEMISQIQQCVNDLKKELTVVDESIRSLPATAQRDEFILHFEKGRKAYPVRLDARLDILSAMKRMNRLFNDNKSKWHIQKANVIVMDLVLSNKLNECRRIINSKLDKIGYY